MNDDMICDFCGKDKHAVKKLIAGARAFICNECIEICSTIIIEQLQPEEVIILTYDDINLIRTNDVVNHAWLSLKAAIKLVSE